MKTRLLIIIGVVFAIVIIPAFALDDENLQFTGISFEENYKIEILGLKDEYTVGEEYSFYFVISGYGHYCANYQASYPDENGNIMHVGAEVFCAPEKSMHEFKINPLEQRGTLGNTGIKKSGTYTVTVTFEKPNKYYPTTISKEFRVVESTENFNKLSPLKQIEAGITIEEIKCKDNLRLILKTGNNSPACVKPETLPKLIKRGWGEPAPEPEIQQNTTNETNLDSEKYYEEFGSDSPLIYKKNSEPLLDYDNCKRYAFWLTEHQKEKIDKYEDYPRYPPWGNQIFPLVDYCTTNGDFIKSIIGDKIQWIFSEFNSEHKPDPKSFRSSEPPTKIEVSVSKPYQNGLVPITFSEVTIFAEKLNEITVWNFELIGHSGDDRGVTWDPVSKEDRISYQIINDDSQDIIDNSLQQNFVIPFDQHAYKMNCGIFDSVYGESAHPTTFKIKPENYAVIAINSKMGIYPDSKGQYSFEFASIFPHYVRFPENSGVEFSSDTKQCSSTWQIDSESGEEHGDGYYTSMTFRFE